MAMNLRKEKAPGEIITFYSYKGGTGRTMALANVACLLARQFQQKVLLIDWDLEAPGLHWYFEQHNLSAKSEAYNQRLQEQPGLIELFEKLSTTVSHPAFDPENAEVTAALVRDLQLDQYIFETYIPNIYLLKAGRFDDDYSTKVNSFQWVEFYNHSPAIFRFLAEHFKQQYAYTLIDSRTGVTDTSGICTALMPEKLVTIFTPNRQSLSGVLDIAKKATDYRKQSDDLRPLVIFPVPSRVETSETTLKSQWRFGEKQEGLLGYQPAFEQLLQQIYDLSSCDLDDYFNEVQIQHFPRYSYGEEIAVLEEDEGDRLSLAQSYESFLKQLLSLIPPWEYVQPRRFEFDVFLSHNTADKPEVRKIASQLKQHGIKPWIDEEQIPPGRSVQEAIEQQIEQVGAMAICIGDVGIGRAQELDMLVLLNTLARQGRPIIPVLLPNAPGDIQLPMMLRDFIWVDFRIQDPDPMMQLIWGITGQKPEA
jgi:cellulose biosynthesis protein BcsQ/nucleotide-binding universal stress UspA family protein